MIARKLLPILIILSMLAAAFGVAMPVAAAGEIVISYTLPAAQVNPNDTFSVPVNITVAAGTLFAGGQFNMSWNPAVLDLVSVSKGTFFASCPAASSDFLNAPTINHTAGTMVNYSLAGLGIASTTGCTGTGLFATLNFKAIAAGLSSQAISGVIMSNSAGQAFPASSTVFPNFNQYVGAAPKLVVTGVAFTPAGGTPPGSTFNVVVTVANTGGVTSSADNMNVTTDGKSTPASQVVPVPAIAGGASQPITINGFQMVAGQQSTTVTAAIPTFNTSASGSYSPVSSSGQTNVDATFGAFIQITPDTAINFGQLALGANSQTGNINVKCNTSYEVDVTDANASAWQMSEWNGATFVASGKKLQDTLTVQATGFTVVTKPGGMLLTGAVAGQGANDAGQNFPLTYKQALHFGDPKLPAGETYHLVLTWNGFVTA